MRAHFETPEERRRYLARSKRFELTIIGTLVAVGVLAACCQGCHDATAPDPHYLRVNILSLTDESGTTYSWDDPIEILVEDDGRILPDHITTGGGR